MKCEFVEITFCEFSDLWFENFFEDIIVTIFFFFFVLSFSFTRIINVFKIKISIDSFESFVSRDYYKRYKNGYDKFYR